MAEETGKPSGRHQAISDLFVGVNSLFLTAAGFSLVFSRLTSWWATGPLQRPVVDRSIS
jgi:hypothetical protein